MNKPAGQILFTPRELNAIAWKANSHERTAEIPKKQLLQSASNEVYR
jgi:hypothetical protein